MDHDKYIESGPGGPEDSDCVGTCPECGGTGTAWMEDGLDMVPVSCPDCKGTGVICG